MASLETASPTEAVRPNFGAWLRELRESKGAFQRSVAAAADMDSSHLGKVERGERLPTPEQAVAIARFLGADETDARIRLVAAKLLAECGGDHALAHSAGGLIQEQAAPYLVNKPANKVRAKK
jgi:transcriptional regulator with XRE-family HTH domain